MRRTRFGRLIVLAMAVALPLSTGCATVANGTRQEVAVTSEPLGAAVFVNDVAVGVTPVRVSLPRRKSAIAVRFEKEGFASTRIDLRRSVSAWIAADAVALNPFARQGLDSSSSYAAGAAGTLAIFLGTDFLTGGAYKFPKVVRAVLTPEREP